MIALFLLLSAASASAPVDPRNRRSNPASARRAVKSSSAERRRSKASYRIPRLPPKTYGPPLPSAQAVTGHGVRLRGQANNSVRGSRNRSTATLSVPF